MDDTIAYYERITNAAIPVFEEEPETAAKFEFLLEQGIMNFNIPPKLHAALRGYLFTLFSLGVEQAKSDRKPPYVL